MDRIVKDKKFIANNEKLCQGVGSCCKAAEWLDRYYVLVCSNCGEVTVHDSNYCPNCGARMNKGVE